MQPEEHRAKDYRWYSKLHDLACYVQQELETYIHPFSVKTYKSLSKAPSVKRNSLSAEFVMLCILSLTLLLSFSSRKERARKEVAVHEILNI